MASEHTDLAAWGGLIAGIAAMGASGFAILTALFSRGHSEGRLVAEMENLARDVQTSMDRGQAAITRADIVNAEFQAQRVENEKRFGEMAALLSALTVALERTTQAVETLAVRLDRMFEGRERRRP